MTAPDRLAAAREAVARWLCEDDGDGNTPAGFMQSADELLSLPEVQALIGQRNEREPVSDVNSAASSSYPVRNPALSGVLAEVVSAISRHESDDEWTLAPFVREELATLPAQREAFLDAAAYAIRSIQAIDRRAGDGQ